MKHKSNMLLPFLSREIGSIAGGVFCGVVGAALLQLFVYDRSFQTVVKSRYTSTLKFFDGPAAYRPIIVLALLSLVVVISLQIWSPLSRGVRSWLQGVTSGMQLICFVATLTIFAFRKIPFGHRIIADLIAITIGLYISWIFYIRAAEAKEHIPNERDVQVSLAIKNRASTQAAESDDPIESWEEDTLGREGLVDSLSVKILISKAPVIALFGDFGSGKTSILNLLRDHLVGKAIVVAFSTWLPGSQETLTSYLMADIASESQKQFVVPGLRRSTRRLAGALGDTVPLLKGLPRLIPPTTQKDDIDSLRKALLRLPKRVVVLLDELDRMQKDELNTLLKVVRGISSLPNLTFVCAAERSTLVETVRGDTSKESYLYFEKFFPVSVPVPKLDNDDLRHAGIERLVKSLKMRQWFESVEEEQTFRAQLKEVWDNRIAPLCVTLRAIGLLANDVGIAAAALYREVDAVDLVLIELLRRFEPGVYDLVARNGVFLTGGESLVRGGSYHTDKEKKRLFDRFEQELKAMFEGDAELDCARGIIGELFPDYAKKENLAWAERPKRKGTSSTGKRISDPSIFPAYFRYELPKAIFSTVELETFIKESKQANGSEARKQLLEDKLRSMEKGSLKKDDFFYKLAESVRTVDIDIAKAWIAASLTLAKDLTYDSLSAFGEAGHVIRMIIRVGHRLPQPLRIEFLSDCILSATDDTIPVRVLTVLTKPSNDAYQDVSFAELYPAFIKRMRSRYGRDVDVGTVDLKTSDMRTFDIWGADDLSKHGLTFDREDRAIQTHFWKRYIGESKSRLIQVFNEYLMPVGWMYSSDPVPIVEHKIDVQTLRTLFNGLPDDPEMTNLPKGYVKRMRRFFNGEFKDGIGIDELDGEPDDEEQEEITLAE